MNVIYITLNKSDIHINLPTTLKLQGKHVGLIDICGSYTPRLSNKELYLCCDFIEENSILSDVNNMYPILRKLLFKGAKKINPKDDFSDKIKEVYSKIIFLPCNRQDVNMIRLYLIDNTGSLVSFKNCELKCSLLIY